MQDYAKALHELILKNYSPKKEVFEKNMKAVLLDEEETSESSGVVKREKNLPFQDRKIANDSGDDFRTSSVHSSNGESTPEENDWGNHVDGEYVLLDLFGDGDNYKVGKQDFYSEKIKLESVLPLSLQDRKFLQQSGDRRFLGKNTSQKLRDKNRRLYNQLDSLGLIPQ